LAQAPEVEVRVGGGHPGFFKSKRTEHAEAGKEGGGFRIRIRTLSLPVWLWVLCVLCGQSFRGPSPMRTPPWRVAARVPQAAWMSRPPA
jgi:hypothetical protein